eukprot:643080_1
MNHGTNQSALDEINAKIDIVGKQIEMLRSNKAQLSLELQQQLKRVITACTTVHMEASKTLIQQTSDYMEEIAALEEVRNEYTIMNTNIKSFFSMSLRELIRDHLDISITKDFKWYHYKNQIDEWKPLTYSDYCQAKTLGSQLWRSLGCLELEMQLDLKECILKVYEMYQTIDVEDTDNYCRNTVKRMSSALFSKSLDMEDYHEDLIEILNKEIKPWHELQQTIKDAFQMTIQELIPKYLDKETKWRHNALFDGYIKQVNKTCTCQIVPMDVILIIGYYYPLLFP